MESPSHIVIVDPRPNDYGALAPWLAAGEFQVHFIPDGRSALRSARLRHSMLWMINADLPDWSGLDLYEMIAPTVNCPIFLVADRYDPDQELAAMALGVSKYLCKPLDFHWIDQVRRMPVMPPPDISNLKSQI
jgi:DNA-binding response OmpR family regulator